MLTKDLLRVSRRGGSYRPQFVGDNATARDLAARLLDTYHDHLGKTRGELDDALAELETEFQFKLVRGFAKLLDREATFETEAPLAPERTRRIVFECAEAVGVADETDRKVAIDQAADRMAVSPDAIEDSLYADREVNQILQTFDSRWTPETLCEQYDLSLAQTALFDATEVRVRSSDPATLISTVKRLRLLYEIHQTADGREVAITGPDALFSRSRRYGTRFARLLRTVAAASEWSLDATIDDRGTERTLRLDQSDISVPGVEPVTEMTFDSGVEADFAARFQSLDLDWSLVREPEPLAAGEHVVIPDFAFDWAHGDFRVFFEIMGFWTPEYVEKKLSRFADLEDVAFLVAVDASLGVGEEVESLTDGAIPYSGTVRVKDVVKALRRYEETLVADARASLPEELTPEDDVVTLTALADRHGVSEQSIETVTFPAHEQVGRTLVRPAILETLGDEIEPGMDLAAVESLLDSYGLDDASAVLARLGYRVAWEGLSGGSIEPRD